MNQVPSPIDFDALLEVLGGDKQIVTSLLSKFVDELTTDLAASEQAITDQDAEVLRQIAHRIKGTSANLRALMLSAAARELEQACTEADASLMTIKQRVMSDQARAVQEAIESWRAES
jgi:HPt (histidine-containing phosphotransfer) domain-containing protein